MATTMTPEMMKAAGMEAPNNQLGAQDAAPQVGKDRKQPGVKKKSAAQKVYPKMKSEVADTADGQG